MPTPVKMPHMGESVAEGTIAKWLKAEGEAVAKDEPLVEVTSDKVDYEIPAKEGPRGGARRGRRKELRRMDRRRAWKALVLGAAASSLLGLTAPVDAAQGMDPHGKGAGGPGMDHLHALAVDPRDGALLMGTHDGLHRSNDEGKTWGKVAPEGEFPGRDVMAIAVDPKQPEIAYAAGHDLGVVKSTDGGRRWLSARAGLPTMDVHALTLDPNDPRKLYAWVDLKGLYRSLDAGRRWARADDGPENPDVRALLSVNIPTGMGGIYLYGGTSDGLFRSMD